MKTVHHGLLNGLVNNSLYDVQQQISKDITVNIMMSINNMVVYLVKFTAIREIDELEERKHGM